jgi:DNA-binding NtrC family response regulator
MAITVLMIDSDETFSRNLAQRLAAEDCRVFTATGEGRARKILQREKIDVVLLGLNEIGHRRLLLLGVIKKIRPLTQVILMLPAEHLSLSIEGMRLGAFDDLLMPFDVETLLERIKAAWEHKQKLQRAGSMGRSRDRHQLQREFAGAEAKEGAAADGAEDEVSSAPIRDEESS